MIVRNRVIALAMSFILIGGTIVFAEPLSDRLQNQKNQLEQNRKLYESVEEEKENIEIQIQKYDVQIEETMDSIEENKKKITKNEEAIKSTELEVKEAEQKVEEEKELMGQRVRSMYKNGSTQYIALLLGSKNFSDLTARVEWIQRVSEYDKKLVAGFEEKKQILDDKQEELNNKKIELVKLKESNEQKLVALSNSSKEQKKLIEELSKKEKLYAAKITESQNAINRTLAQIQNIRSSAPKYIPSRGAAPISDNAIIAYASNFLGTPYVWGGTTPDPGFDCSGFTRYVYAHFGVKMGRTTKNQIYDGAAVSKSQLEVGDLVFFGDNGVPNHVGIYAGNGTYIHSPQTGDVVKISAMTRKDFIIGRRVK